MRSTISREWKDAATLMLVAKANSMPIPCTCSCQNNAQTQTLPPLSFKTVFPSASPGLYRNVDAKSELLGSEDGFLDNGSCNFKTLMLTRSSKSGFMPSALVFPGGIVDDADFNLEWRHLFDKVLGATELPRSANILTSLRPPIFMQQMNNSLDLDLAFRICAIRETFEEIGILLVRGKPGTEVCDLGVEDKTAWRQLVHKNADNFLRLCDELEVVPDVWSLFEWANWLTPIRLAISDSREAKLSGPVVKGRRYDTAFYVATLPEIPSRGSYSHDDMEITKAQWLNPFQALDLHYAGKAWMAPPQIYEQSRLLRFPSLAAFESFCRRRQEASVSRWLPVTIQAEDGVASVLPGDQLYPSDESFDFNNDVPPAFHGTLATLRASTDQHNRFEMRSASDCSLVCNIPPSNSHVAPLSIVQLEDQEEDEA